MVTIGDVLAVVAGLAGVGVTAWAMMVCCGLLFPLRVERAREAAEQRAWRNMGLGLLVLIPGILGLALLANPLPPVKLVGWVFVLAVLATGALGAAGLGHVAGRTLSRMAPDLGAYPAFVRGCAFLVTGSMLPILGWFAFAPVALLVSFGAGAKAIAAPVAPPVAAGVRS